MADDDDAVRDRKLHEAAAEYLRLQPAGTPVDRWQWLARYPDLAEDLAAFLSDLDQLRMAGGMQARGLPVPADSCARTVDHGPPGGDASGFGAAAQEAPVAPRYRLRNFLAAGGMGEVWLADDTHVGRQIAVKRIRNGRQAGSTVEMRFLFESQIMGQLEHPCIVPLHDLGRNEAGELFSVMKLVQGNSLKQRLESFHAAKVADWPRQVEFQRLLEAFVSICHAVAYAHSRGVLHRDIKPDNIMLGDYGEALLLDWGLAKALHVPEVPVDKPAAPGRVRLTSGSSTATQAGAVMGSPVYMSPEVAAGESQSADERTDVYLLGATLYELLTARPPRSGTSALELIEIARRTPPPPPRTIDPRVPKALEAICGRAMALNRADRYPSAAALAREIENFLAGEAVLAYREPPAARAWRWCRRHRRALARTSVAMILVVFATFGYAGFRRARDFAARETARQQLAEFHRLADEARFFAANSDAPTERAPYYEPRRATDLGDRALALAGIWSTGGAKLPLADQRAALQSQLYELQVTLASLYQQSTAAGSQTRALALLDQAAALRPASRVAHQIRARCLRQLGRTTEADREEERAGARSAHLTALDWFLEGEFQRTNAAAETPVSGPATGSFDAATIRRAVAAYQQALRIDPQHYWAQFQLARCYLRLQRGPEAVEALGTCIALRPDAPWAYSTRGLIHGMLGQFDLAHADLEQALRLAPEFRPARLNRGFVYSLQGRDPEALADFEAALQPPADAALIEAAFYRALLHERRGDDVAALRDCQRFLETRRDFRPAWRLAAQLYFRQRDDSNAMLCLDVLLAAENRPVTGAADGNVRVARGRLLRSLAPALDPVTQQRVLRLALHEFEAADRQDTVADVVAIKDLLGLTEEAIVQYTERLAAVPHDVDTRVLRGWCYVRLQSYDLAASDFQMAIAAAPDDAEAHSGLGYVHALSGDRVGAELAALRASLLGAQDYLALNNVACIYGELAHSVVGQTIEYENRALVTLERAVHLARHHPGAFDEVGFLRSEPSFHSSLRARPEFQRLLGEGREGGLRE